MRKNRRGGPTTVGRSDGGVCGGSVAGRAEPLGEDHWYDEHNEFDTLGMSGCLGLCVLYLIGEGGLDTFVCFGGDLDGRRDVAILTLRRQDNGIYLSRQ